MLKSPNGGGCWVVQGTGQTRAWYDLSEPVRPYATNSGLSSCINFKRSVEYGLGVLATTVRFVAHKAGIIQSPAFGPRGRKITQQYYTHVQQGS